MRCLSTAFVSVISFLNVSASIEKFYVFRSWWFSGCSSYFLNGRYVLTVEPGHGDITWADFHSDDDDDYTWRNPVQSQMKLRKVQWKYVVHVEYSHEILVFFSIPTEWIRCQLQSVTVAVSSLKRLSFEPFKKWQFLKTNTVHEKPVMFLVPVIFVFVPNFRLRPRDENRDENLFRRSRDGIGTRRKSFWRARDGIGTKRKSLWVRRKSGDFRLRFSSVVHAEIVVHVLLFAYI